VIDFPNIDPVAIAIGPLQIRWYALAYLTGFLLGWAVALRLNRLYGEQALPKQKIDDFMMWVVIGVIAGGRMGYVLFYNLPYFLADPTHILRVWEGGMSFHGGAAGVIIAIIGFALYHKINMYRLADIVCAVVPIGLLFGRLANFINGELYGRVTTAPWGVVFPGTDGQPRHPSQLYEAFGEGLILLVVLMIMMQMRAVRDRPGLVSAVFLMGYGLARFLVEFVREPDVQLGMLSYGLTMGQTLCLPMILGGLMVAVLSQRQRRM
jgi:phosphatidylglycerol---prolipoprotein diacylglyceryl transferase